MGIQLSTKRTVSVEVEIDGVKHVVRGTCRVMTSAERAAFQGAAAAAAAGRAASTPDDKRALAALGDAQSFMQVFAQMAARCILDLETEDGGPVEVDGKRWRDMTEAERLDAQAAGLESVASEVFNAANRSPEARLLGK